MATLASSTSLQEPIRLASIEKRLQNKVCIERERGHMPIRYCSQHARFLGGKYCEWMDSPVEKMQAIKALYGFFHAAHIEASAYRVIETGCDRCQEVAGQKLREELKKTDPAQ
jgi:hypothetical protein